MANKQIKARLPPEEKKIFDQLKIIWGIENTFGSDSETIRRATVAAYKHEELKKKIKELFGFDI